MKIVIMVTASVTATKFVKGFAEFTAKSGFDVYVIADGLEKRSRNMGNGALTTVGISMDRNPNPTKDALSLWALTKLLRTIKPDVAIYATPKASLLGSIASSFARVPTRIYQLWGLRLETVRWPGKAILSVIEIITSGLSTLVLANSKSLAAKYQSMHLNTCTAIKVIGEGSSHGVDLDYFSAEQLNNAKKEHKGRNAEYLTVGFIGRLHPDKGIDTLIESLEILAFRKKPVSAVIVGNNEGFDTKVPSIISDLIEFVGFANDTRPYYEMIDVLILPSLREGFPNVVLEASAMGVPSIVSNSTGTRDSVKDGETGIVFPAGDATALANAIEQFIDDREKLKTFGVASRIRAESSFSQEFIWSETLGTILRTKNQQTRCGQWLRKIHSFFHRIHARFQSPNCRY